MESYTDMKYSDCGCSGRCRKVSVTGTSLYEAVWIRRCRQEAESGIPQMGNQMNDGMPQMIPETGNNWENNGNFGWNRMPGLEGNAFCPGSMPGMLEKDYPLAMAYVPWQQWQTPYGPERGLAKEPSFQSWTWPLIKGGAAR